MHQDGDTAYDPYTHGVLQDPFANTITRSASDPLLASNGDPVLHYAGEVRTYLGGEPVLDESGRPVVNADGSLFTHEAGQIAIHDRGDAAYVADSKTFAYASSIDLSTGHAREEPVRLGRRLELRPHARPGRRGDRPQPAAALRALRGQRLHAERQHAHLHRCGAGGDRGLTGVSLEVTFALRAFYVNGDPQLWTGTEAVVGTDPIVTGSGDTWSLATDDAGNVLTYGANILDAHGNPILHKRGEQKFELVEGKWVAVDLRRLLADREELPRHRERHLLRRRARVLQRRRAGSDDAARRASPDDRRRRHHVHRLHLSGRRRHDPFDDSDARAGRDDDHRADGAPRQRRQHLHDRRDARRARPS